MPIKNFCMKIFITIMFQGISIPLSKYPKHIILPTLLQANGIILRKISSLIGCGLWNLGRIRIRDRVSGCIQMCIKLGIISSHIRRINNKWHLLSKSISNLTSITIGSLIWGAFSWLLLLGIHSEHIGIRMDMHEHHPRHSH